PEPTDPVAPARRSTAADRKAASKTSSDQLPVHDFSGLLNHLATLTRNELRFLAIENQPVVEQLALPTPTQRRAFELLDRPIPLTLA
ncbi:MAG: IS1634 family transposase, partial [Actinomycetes bacterium]